MRRGISSLGLAGGGAWLLASLWWVSCGLGVCGSVDLKLLYSSLCSLVVSRESAW